MEKIKVSREVAEFIEGYKDNVAGYLGWEDDLIIEHSRTWANSFEGAKESAMCMKDISPLELSKILIYGYEVEKTPEEMVLALYKVVKDEITAKNLQFDKGMAAGIVMTLKKLNIEIEGVTDDH